MANKMLIDASHPEETRVVVLRGNRVEEFDFESASRKQLRGNIYLAKVTRVEPSLQAAFVDYGGNRHGFLAFSEIHPDYYQIPVADRQALIEEEERAQRAADAEADHRAGRRRGRTRPASRVDESVRSEEPAADAEAGEEDSSSVQLAADRQPSGDEDVTGFGVGSAFGSDMNPGSASGADLASSAASGEAADAVGEPGADLMEKPAVSDKPADSPAEPGPEAGTAGDEERGAVAADALPDPADSRAKEFGESDVGKSRDSANGNDGNGDSEDGDSEEDAVESVGGGDALEEVQERMLRPRREYKIQEVIKRRQVMLVQVVKEERGTKGAALTTYLSLAGRYSVLMPNTARGGGISRKITNSEDRRRLKEIAQDLEVPEGMGVILRTAGASRTKAEVRRDFEYLLRLWESVRDMTLKSTAPKLVYEEGSLLKRAIRDLYSKEIEEVIVAGEEGYREVKDFMRMLMPSQVKSVRSYSDSQPLFTRHGIESQLDAMFSPVVPLKSGGYIVLNQTEALVAIDVNSGRSTREHHIEDTALKTNTEAADEIARQLRLRDLAGLIVIDFIDMEEKRNNRTVERRLKESLKHDRARIQIGRISPFGLLEMSRQRIRSSVLESSTEKCPECGGLGHVRSVASVALQLLRSLEEMLLKSATHNLSVRTRTDVALYVLNQKRVHLRALEERFKLTITISADSTVAPPQVFVVERGEQVHTPEAAKALAVQPDSVAAGLEPEEEALSVKPETDELAAGFDTAPAEQEVEEEAERRRRRRRRRRRSTEPQAAEAAESGEAAEGLLQAEFGAPKLDTEAEAEEISDTADTLEKGMDTEMRRRRARRGRRGRRDREVPAEAAAMSEAVPPPVESFELSPLAVDAEAPQPREEAPPAPEPEAEQPRRRSTVREPAPIVRPSAVDEPLPNPPAPERRPERAPAPAESTADEKEVEEGQPRRTGWWARRLIGRS